MHSTASIGTNTVVTNRQVDIVEKGSGCQNTLKSDGWNLLSEEVSFPIAVIKEKQLIDNARWMQEFSERANVKLAPHGKTTMAPSLFKLQRDLGSWGISLATVPQVVNASAHGINRIILANQLIGVYHMKLIADLLKRSSLEFYCFVDSIDNVNALGQFFSAAQQPLNVLLEVGVEDGRSGWRDTQNIRPLVDAVSQHPYLQLSGVSFYEGVIHGQGAETKIACFIDDICSMLKRLFGDKRFADKDIIVTGAGSAWYDIVAKHLVSNFAQHSRRFIPIIRPGCYLIHDKGIYQSVQNEVLQRSQLACDIDGDLVSNLELWAYVHSVPEPGLAIIGLGKRDVAFDAGLPMPEYVYRPGTERPEAIYSDCKVVKIMDQHCMMKFPTTEQLKPGDIVIFATSHPCLTMDKWRQVGLIDSNFVVRKILETYF